MPSTAVELGDEPPPVTGNPHTAAAIAIAIAPVRRHPRLSTVIE
jgi:hypothetical protein